MGSKDLAFQFASDDPGTLDQGAELLGSAPPGQLFHAAIGGHPDALGGDDIEDLLRAWATALIDRLGV